MRMRTAVILKLFFCRQRLKYAGAGVAGGRDLQSICGGPPGDFVATQGRVGGVVEGIGWHEAQAIGNMCPARTHHRGGQIVGNVKRNGKPR